MAVMISIFERANILKDPGFLFTLYCRIQGETTDHRVSDYTKTIL